MITILLALSTAARAVEDHGHRPTFHAQDCQECLFDHAAEIRRQIGRTLGPGGRAAVTVERAMVGVDPSDDFALDDPRFVWFTAAATEDSGHVRARANAAAHAGAVRPETRAAPTFSTRAPTSVLTPFELETLGLTGTIEVAPGEISGRVERRPGGWHLEFATRGQTHAGVDLTLTELELGYTNAVYEWQWQRIADAGRRFEDVRVVTPLDFVAEHAHVMFTRSVGDRRVGYVLRSYPTPSGAAVTQLEIALVRPVRRLASSTADLVFAKPDDRTAALEAPPLNLGVSDLGLRLVLAPGRGPE